MAPRRWLTAQYDWTGLARKFYTSEIWEFGSMIFVGLLTILLIVLLSGPMVTEQVGLNTFAPVEIVHIADWVMAGLLVFFIGGNILRMFQMVILKEIDTKIPLYLYITEAWRLILNAVTQKRWADCAEYEQDEKTQRSKKTSWIVHMLMASGYGLMLILIIFFLGWFQTDEIYPIYHPHRWLGYYATVVLLLGAGWALWRWINKET